MLVDDGAEPLIAFYALSIASFVAGAAIGVAVSVLSLDADTARRSAIVVDFALSLLESLSVVADQILDRTR